MATSHVVMRDQNLPQVLARTRQLLIGMAPMLLLYALYTVVRFLVKDRGPAEGIRNANDVLHLERRLGFDWEGAIQKVLLPHEWLVVVANWYYVAGFLPVILVAAGISAMLDYQNFLWWRRRFALTLILALIGFALYPLAPPRMLPGMVDTLMVYGPRYYGDHDGASIFNLYGRIPSLVNVYAAMPSMHVAWSIIAGALMISALRKHWWIWIVGVAHPVLMAVAVVVTANHYVLDVVVGVAALLGALGLLRLGNALKSRWIHD
ncbi:MAG: phosphatase PAP2 family protein [Chloroflexota bacterium]|nr:phosphatase PAP2 family protein [Chloroflexota bacterium]